MLFKIVMFLNGFWCVRGKRPLASSSSSPSDKQQQQTVVTFHVRARVSVTLAREGHCWHREKRIGVFTRRQVTVLGGVGAFRAPWR